MCITVLFLCSFSLIPVQSAKLMYRMDTSNGSEGAPIFKEVNNEIRLIAMHTENHGVLISKIVEHMMKK